MKKDKKFFWLITFVCIILIVSFIKIYDITTGDHMDNKGIAKIKYRVYIQKKGWSKWVKSGVTAGNYKNPISMIQIKQSTGDDIVFSYTPDGNKWVENLNLSADNLGTKNTTIRAVKFDTYVNQAVKYDIYYRTYNKKNKWLEWTSNYNVSGNKNEDILAFSMKIIPVNVIKSDYLKDFKDNDKTNVGF